MLYEPCRQQKLHIPCINWFLLSIYFLRGIACCAKLVGATWQNAISCKQTYSRESILNKEENLNPIIATFFEKQLSLKKNPNDMFKRDKALIQIHQHQGV
jgi:hypothetical protein